MSIFEKLFGRKPLLADAADAKVWKTGSEFVGAALLSQFMEGTRLLVPDEELRSATQEIPEAQRSLVELWANIYAAWLLQLLAKAQYGDKFGREVMAAVYGRIAANEDRAPGIEAIAEGIKFWFSEIDAAIQRTMNKPVQVAGQTVPPVYFVTLSFLARDDSSPYYNTVDAEFDGFDFAVAGVLARIQDQSKTRIDFILEAAGKLPR